MSIFGSVLNQNGVLQLSLLIHDRLHGLAGCFLPRTEPNRQPKLYAKCHFDNSGPDRTMIIYVLSEVRLVGGSRCSGRLEILHDQSRMSVCDAAFDQQDAEVVCSELDCGVCKPGARMSGPP